MENCQENAEGCPILDNIKIYHLKRNINDHMQHIYPTMSWGRSLIEYRIILAIENISLDSHYIKMEDFILN